MFSRSARTVRCASYIARSSLNLRSTYVRSFFYLTPEPGPNMSIDKPHGLYTVSFFFFFSVILYQYSNFSIATTCC